MEQDSIAPESCKFPQQPPLEIMHGHRRCSSPCWQRSQNCCITASRHASRLHPVQQGKDGVRGVLTSSSLLRKNCLNQFTLNVICNTLEQIIPAVPLQPM
eukprot:3918006-Amphidinium_carterae.1